MCIGLSCNCEYCSNGISVGNFSALLLRFCEGLRRRLEVALHVAFGILHTAPRALFCLPGQV